MAEKFHHDSDLKKQVKELQDQQRQTVTLVQSINKRVTKLEKKPIDEGLSAAELTQVMAALDDLSRAADMKPKK